MTLNQLRYAVTVANAKSMNKAALHLYISQPALSGAIKDLEEDLGFEIFSRTSRGIIPTTEGEEFLSYARQIVEMTGLLEERFIASKQSRKKFSVSMQHYSFAVQAFIELAGRYSMDEFEFAVHETRTYEVINNVKTFKSELGVLYTDSFNETALLKVFRANELEFTPLFDCGISVYLSSSHPLAGKKKIKITDLAEYPCLSFEQGDMNSFYFAEEVMSTYDYKRIIKADDRATMLNLMDGMNGYTLCSGIICQELNGGSYVSVPLDTKERMTIGYIRHRGFPLSKLASEYIEILKTYR